MPPALAGGMRLRTWLRVLRENRCDVEPRYWLRGGLTTLLAAANSASARADRLVYGRRLARLDPKPPIIILGHWRSGTTHLHKLLSLDDRMVTPTTFRVVNPSTFLLTERVMSRVLSPLAVRKRPMDAMQAGIDETAEDEFALCGMTGQSQCMGWIFPRSADQYERCLTFDGVDDENLDEWIEALRLFVRRLVVRDPARIPVLKSPQHTGRVRHLLRAFPNARFVKIHRHPYAVFPSTLHTWRNVVPYLQMHTFDENGLEDRIIRQYRVIHDAFFEQRELIPDGHYHEMSYDELVGDPMSALRGLYDALDLPDFESCSPAMQAHLDSVRDYRPNAFPALPQETRTRLAEAWRPSFEAWNYAS